MKNIKGAQYLPTLSELLKLPIFKDARILCGEGMDLPVSSVFLSEIPDYYNWVAPGELVITNCYALYNSPDLLREFVPRLFGLGVAGACVKPDRFLGGMVPEDMISAAQELGFPLVELPAGIRFSDITKAVSDELLRRQTTALRTSLAVGELLTRTITEGASLDEIAVTVQEITGRSVLILDAINHRQSVALTNADAEQYPQLEAASFFEEIMRSAEPHEMATADNSFGTLYLFGEKHEPELQPELLRQILLAIPLEISRFHSVHESDKRGFSEFFFHLLSDSVMDDTAEQARADSFGFRLSDRHILLSLRMRETTTGNLHAMLFYRTVFFRALREIVGGAVENVRYMDRGGDTLVLLSSPDGVSPLSELPQQLCDKLSLFLMENTELSIAVGCSRPHTGISGLISCNKEANLALRAAESRQKSKVLRFDDLGILSLLYANDPDKEIKEFVKDTLKDLIYPSLTRGTELLETLESYFRCLGNQRKMAEELYVHYNTVAYRLKQIQEITEKEFTNSEDRMSLELALYLYRFFHLQD